jgi:hypothetical protein
MTCARVGCPPSFENIVLVGDHCRSRHDRQEEKAIPKDDVPASKKKPQALYRENLHKTLFACVLLEAIRDSGGG